MNSSRSFLAAELMLNIIRGMLTIFLGLYLYRETGSVFSFALTILADLATTMVLQGASGSLVDHYGPKKILLVCAILNVVALTIGCVAVYSFDQSLVLVTIVGLGIALNALKPAFRAGTFALIGLVVAPPEIARFNANFSIARQVGQLSGMFLIAILLDIIGPFYSLVVIAIFSASCVLLYNNIRVTQETVTVETKAVNKATWSQVLRLARDNTKVRMILTIGSLDVGLVAVFNVFLAPMVNHTFQNSSIWMGIIDGLFAVGAILAGIVISRRGLLKDRNYIWSVLGVFCLALIFASSTFSLALYVTPALVFFLGIAITCSGVNWSTELQYESFQDIKGRIASLRHLINSINSTLLVLVTAFLIDRNYNSGAMNLSVVMASIAVLVLIAAVYFRVALSRHPDVDEQDS